MTTTANIVIVNDGQYRWGADRQALEAAMERLGWAKDGRRRWIEPEGDDEDDPMAAYTALCQEVQPAPGYEPENNSEEWDDLDTLTFREDLGQGVWVAS
ncbi:MAG TPA: hypothetical protein VEB64_04840 [Azospirillaceae bacterium]|nr:hypothetical protein [Azospirillaceae bacterium]